MKRLPWKYVAGLMDGEGCVKLNLRKSKDKEGNVVFYPQIGIELTLTETSKHVIDYLHNSNGGKVYRREYDSPNWKPTYTWRLYAKTDVRAFCQNLYKHTYIKNEQMRFAIWCIDNLKAGLTTEVAKVLKEELKLQKGDPHRLSEKAQERILQLL